MTKKKLLPKVRSIRELYSMAEMDEGYKKLLIVASNNLGGPSNPTIQQANQWLVSNAVESNSESGVVREINACRDMV